MELLLKLHLKKAHDMKDVNITMKENHHTFPSYYGKDYDNKNIEKKMKILKDETLSVNQMNKS